jgi:hypothetical protein
MQTAKPTAPLKVRRPADMGKASDLIMSDDDDGLLDLETAPATKPTAKPIVAPPPYEGQDPDIDGRNGLNELDRLNELQDLARRAQGVFSLTSPMVQQA